MVTKALLQYLMLLAPDPDFPELWSRILQVLQVLSYLRIACASCWVPTFSKSTAACCPSCAVLEFGFQFAARERQHAFQLGFWCINFLNVKQSTTAYCPVGVLSCWFPSRLSSCCPVLRLVTLVAEQKSTRRDGHLRHSQ